MEQKQKSPNRKTRHGDLKNFLENKFSGINYSENLFIIQHLLRFNYIAIHHPDKINARA